MPLPTLSDELQRQMLRGLKSHDVPKHLLTRFGTVPGPSQGLPAYDVWMEKTKLGAMKPRSTRLKRIDKALKEAHLLKSVRSYNELRSAINDWCRWKQDWKASERNKDHIVEILRIQAFAPGLPTAMTREEEQAWAEVLKSRKLVLQRHFTGKRVKLKLTGALSGAKDVATSVKSAHSSFKKVYDGAKQGFPAPDKVSLGAAKTAAENFVKDDLLNLKPEDLLHLGDIPGIQDLATDFVPVLNLVIGGVKVIKKWADVAAAAHKRYQTEDRAYVIEKGDPAHAFNALVRMLKRDTKSKAIKAGSETAKFGGQLAGTFADGGAVTGPVIAAVNAAATLAHTLFLLGREIKESRKANKLLADPANLDFRIFEAYPLLGCYLIRCADLSDIIAMSTAQFGSGGWMDEIEKLKKSYIDPMIKSCDTFIDNSMFHIPDMAHLKR